MDELDDDLCVTCNPIINSYIKNNGEWVRVSSEIVEINNSAIEDDLCKKPNRNGNLYISPEAMKDIKSWHARQTLENVKNWSKESPEVDDLCDFYSPWLDTTGKDPVCLYCGQPEEWIYDPILISVSQCRNPKCTQGEV